MRRWRRRSTCVPCPSGHPAGGGVVRDANLLTACLRGTASPSPSRLLRLILPVASERPQALWPLASHTPMCMPPQSAAVLSTRIANEEAPTVGRSEAAAHAKPPPPSRVRVRPSLLIVQAEVISASQYSIRPRQASPSRWIRKDMSLDVPRSRSADGRSARWPRTRANSASGRASSNESGVGSALGHCAGSSFLLR